MQNLIQKFKEIGNLSPKNEKALFSALKRIECPPKTILQEIDKVCNKVYFIEKGIARTFNYKDGKDITYWISMGKDFIGAVASYFMREPSQKIVETIESCVLWELDYYRLEELFNSNQELGNIGRLFSNYGLSLVIKRFDSLHFNSAKERYDILINKEPEILQRVPLGIIASYLGITQETLSRIRKQK